MKNLHDVKSAGCLGRRWLVAVTVLLLHLSSVRGETAQTSVPAKLRRALDEAIATCGSSTDCEALLSLVARIDRCLVGQDANTSEVWLKVRFVEAVANMRLNKLSQSARQIAELRAKISQEHLPELWFRCRSVAAALQLFRGDRTGCVESLETLLSGDTSDVDPEYVNRAMVNYAAALNECGRTGEAADRYEEVMLSALEQGHDLAALQSGNNLISILVDVRDYTAAQRALAELDDVAARNSDKLASRVLRLRELDLLRLRGRVESAITGLRSFLVENSGKPVVLNGVAHRILADSLRQKSRLEEAAKHARTSLKLLQNRANEVVRTRITLAQILMEMGDYHRVLAILSKADPSTDWVPSRRKAVERLRLEASLRLGGKDTEVDALLAMIDADKTHDKQVSRSRSDYYSAKLEAARRKMETREAQARAEIAVKATNAERAYRNVLVASIGTFALASCVVAFLYSRRKAERVLLAEQQALTVELEEIVKTKTNELRENLSARAKLAKALERKKRMEAIGLLAGNVAHDINNLLQVIASTNETLASTDVESRAKTELLDVSNESLRNASAVIRNLLAFSRQQELSAVPICVSDYLERTTALLHAAVGDSVELVVRNEAAANVSILADSAQLTTSLLNILGNAVDAMPDGGRIEFVAKVLVVSVVTPDDSTVPGEYLELRITDSGCGMTEEQVACAFEPFYSTKTESGTGLGLSSAFGFAKQSRGDIHIESTPGVGTSVAMLLPVVNVPIPKVVDSEDAVQMPGVRRVLLVEDHNGVAMSLQALLQHLGFETTHVASGELARQRLEQGEKFGFVLSDVCMPGVMDGPTLADWVHENIPDTPIFLMSGYNELAREGHDLPLIQKPFNASQLNRFLQENLEPLSA